MTCDELRERMLMPIEERLPDLEAHAELERESIDHFVACEACEAWYYTMIGEAPPSQAEIDARIERSLRSVLARIDAAEATK